MVDARYYYTPVSYRDITRFYYVKCRTELHLRRLRRRGIENRSAPVVVSTLPPVPVLPLTPSIVTGSSRHRP
jgi:hypothetical protein